MRSFVTLDFQKLFLMSLHVIRFKLFSSAL